MLESMRDLTPIIGVIAFFQLVVLQQPIPDLIGFFRYPAGGVGSPCSYTD